MKYFVAILGLFLASTVFASDGECQPFKRGDMNGDGAVNTADALALFNHLLNPTDPTKLPHDGQMDRADVNNDGVIDGSDGSLLYGLAYSNTPSTLFPPFDYEGFDIYENSLDNLAHYPGCDLDSTFTNVTFQADDWRDWAAEVDYNHGWDVVGEYNRFGWICAFHAKTSECKTPNPFEYAVPTCEAYGYMLYIVPIDQEIRIAKRMIESNPSAGIRVFFDYGMTLSVPNANRCDPYECGTEYSPYDTQIIDFLFDSVEVQLNFINSSLDRYVVAQQETQADKYRYNYTWNFQSQCQAGYYGVTGAAGTFDSVVDPDIGNGYVLKDEVGDDDMLYLSSIKIFVPSMILHVAGLEQTLLTSYEMSFHIANVEFELVTDDIE